MGSHKPGAVHLCKSHQALTASSKSAQERKTRAVRGCTRGRILNEYFSSLMYTLLPTKGKSFQEQRNQGHCQRLRRVLPLTIMPCTGREPTPKPPASHRAHRCPAESWHFCCPLSSVFSPLPSHNNHCPGRERDSSARLSLFRHKPVRDHHCSAQGYG